MPETTILFADIASSTALYESIGDAQAENLINSLLSSLCSIIEQNKGKVIRTIGDEVMCQFPDSTQAILAANQMHEYTANKIYPNINKKISIRVGAHVGSVITTGDDVFGDTVNVSARVVALARPGKTMISEYTFTTLPDYLKGLCRNMTATYIKGKELPINIYDVVWEQNDQLTGISNKQNSQSKQKILILNYHSKQFLLTEKSFTIGRDAECDLVVEAPMTSRVHCEIRNNGHKFTLIDTSTNGTYIRQSNIEILFQNETAALHQSGVFSLGLHSDKNPEHLFTFSIKYD